MRIGTKVNLTNQVHMGDLSGGIKLRPLQTEHSTGKPSGALWTAGPNSWEKFIGGSRRNMGNPYKIGGRVNMFTLGSANHLDSLASEFGTIPNQLGEHQINWANVAKKYDAVNFTGDTLKALELKGTKAVLRGVDIESTAILNPNKVKIMQEAMEHSRGMSPKRMGMVAAAGVLVAGSLHHRKRSSGRHGKTAGPAMTAHNKFLDFG